MGLTRYSAKNHPQQVAVRGALNSIDDRETPYEFFEQLDNIYRFTVDVAAAEHNTRVFRFYDHEANGLEQSWAGERVWCNPPFSDIPSWVRKAHNETTADVIVMLLPANRTEQKWWHEFVEPHRDRGGRLTTQFIQGRLRFAEPGEPVRPNNRPPFGVCLLIWK